MSQDETSPTFKRTEMIFISNLAGNCDILQARFWPQSSWDAVSQKSHQSIVPLLKIEDSFREAKASVSRVSFGALQKTIRLSLGVVALETASQSQLQPFHR